MRPEHGQVRVPHERHAPRQAFVEQRGERVDVRARVDGRAFDRLRRHVVDRSQQSARELGVVVGALGQAEVGQEGSPARVEQDVRRLHVAVDQAVLVCLVQGISHRRDDRERPRRLETPSLRSSVPRSVPST